MKNPDCAKKTSNEYDAKQCW